MQAKKESLAKAEQAYKQALAEQKATIESQKQLELAAATQAFNQTLAQKESQLKQQTQQALSRVKNSFSEALSAQKQALENQKKRDLEQAQREYDQALASKESDLMASKQQALAQAKQAYEKAIEERTRNMQAANQQQLGKAQKTFSKLLAENEKRLSQAKEQALSAAEKEFARKLGEEKANSGKLKGQLDKFLSAMEAKEKIVTQLKDNFRDFNSSAVEVDSKTGKVKLHFQQSYFKRGKGELTDEMKAILRVMIPRYAKSIYGNKDAAKQVGSLKITGLTSPVYKGKYIDINDTSEEAEKARKFNIKLSNERALAMFSFIFNDPSMKDFPYRDELKKDMGISAQGFLNAQPVPKELIGKKARCIKYDCSQEQAAVLQFQMNLE
ncbi:MAG TPA: hypothetical protein ENJ28_07585 [Gammaproteobacteria bacterium]|nr:hypothetical protein [Gammaproteobacteria bacterium]